MRKALRRRISGPKRRAVRKMARNTPKVHSELAIQPPPKRVAAGSVTMLSRNVMEWRKAHRDAMPAKASKMPETWAAL